MNHGLRRRLPVALAAVIVLGFLGLFFAWPVAAIVGLGLRGEAGAVLVEPSTWRLVGFTLGQAAASTAVALLAGLPLAYVLARLAVPGRGLLRVAVTVPFVLPTIVVGMAFRALFGADAGVLAIVLANAFFNVAVVARTVSGLWSHLDRRMEDAARSLGASRLRAFTSVTLPALLPALGSAASVVFLFSATSFGVVLVLGGGELRTLETEIYLRTVQLLDLPGAAALSLLQLAAVVAALLVATVARRRRETALRLRAPSDTARRPQGAEWWVVGLAGLVLCGLGTPIVTLLLRSVSTRDGWGLAGYRALLGTGQNGTLEVTGLEAALNSVRTAVDATWMALLFGLLASFVLVAIRRRAVAESLDLALMLPLGVSAVTVGFGYLITLGSLPGDLRTSPLLVPFAQALVVTPLVIRMVLPVLRAIDERLRQAAATLGAGPWRVRREIDVPLAARTVLAAAGFGFVIALGEFGATGFLARPDAPTLPVAIARLLGRPGELNSQLAYAACTLLMIVTVLGVVLIERLRGRTDAVEEF
ncbi:iron ABC transporter permease [Saccharopolyspora gloriosae]|uniref:Thiamine transport system permease protein n=1 Tax=Saccharopolyspora gloriosae TaxID=455344 RepID=A0A840NGL4_9PSEU|nr:iron ABC transporter permease [Saccharopolyspora gloriosae]MBB5067407.1 thiamine transport system permease protein [Saccharopolyspora gloriosae]